MALHSSSHSSSHANHSSSHASHSNSHASHSSSHASHSNGHSNSAAHSNSQSVSDTLGWSGAITGQHSVTATQIASSVSSGKVGVYGGTGTLSAIAAVIQTARSTMNAPNAAYTGYGTTTGVKLNQAAVTNLLASAGGKNKWYKNGTIHMNAHASHGNTGATNTLPTTNTEIDVTKTNTQSTANSGPGAQTFPGYTGAGETANKTVSNVTVSTPDVIATIANPTYSVPAAGTKLTAATRDAIVATIKKVTGSTVAGFGTYTLGGAYNTTHGSHASHSSSHASHSNSHASHSNSHASHSSSHSSHSSSHSSHSDCSLRVKENITACNLSALDLINNLQLKAFTYKPGFGYDPSIQHYGFIAEDTSEIFSTKYHDRMDYMNCIAILFKAVQELAQKI